MRGLHPQTRLGFDDEDAREALMGGDSVCSASTQNPRKGERHPLPLQKLDVPLNS